MSRIKRFIPISAFAPIAILSGFMSAHLRQSHYPQDSHQRICANRITSRIPASAFAPVVLLVGFASAHLRRSQSGLYSHYPRLNKKY
jgi:hypothetical protein